VESERQKQCGRSKGKGSEPSSVPVKGCPGMGSGGDRCLCALRHEGGHRAVTRSVASGMGVVTGAHGWKPAWAVDWWARPGYKFSFQFPIQPKFVNFKWKPSLAPKIFNLCMWLDLNILNNFLNWVDFNSQQNAYHKFWKRI
jgi:hypothetical protein